MATKNLGAVTAYAYAKAGGYEGTEAEFQELMAALPDSVEDAQEAVSTVTGLTAQATKVASTAPARATYNKIANRIDFEIPEGNGIASVTLTSTSGAVKTYTITFDDGTTTTFNVTDGEITQEVLDEAITELDEKKANYDGYYDEMTVGTAEQLISSATIEDDDLYVFRSAGGTNDIGNRETDMLVGGTVAWNQLVPNTNKTTKTDNGITFTVNADGSVTLNGTATADATFNYGRIDAIKDHKYAVVGIPSGASSTGHKVVVLGTMFADTIRNISTSDYWTSRIIVTSGTTVTNVRYSPLCIDLTAMFGTEIADYIYSLEQAEAGKGVAWFRKYFPKPYYAYDAGSLQSVNVASHDTTGFNQWDEEWELGSIYANSGIKYATSDSIRSKNYIEVMPNTTYYFKASDVTRHGVFYYDADKQFIGVGVAYTKNVTFTTPGNCHYLLFDMAQSYGTTYKGDICINRVWTGYRNGEYEEYVKHSYPYDETVELRGIPQLVDGKLKYDGDTYESSGKVTRKYGTRNLGEVTWTATSGCYIYSPSDAKQKFKGLISGKLVKVNKDYSELADGEWTSSGGANRSVWVKNTMAESPAAFKTLMSGIYLIYEKETPTEETAEAYTNPQICDDFGTEEYVDAGVKNGTRDVAIPVGHVTNYMANLRDKLQHLPSLASSDGDYLVNQNGTSMSLKPIAPYFNTEHPNLVAGSANQLLSTITIEDRMPYKFRTSGGSVDIGDRETDMIVGGTIAWNQLIEANMSNGTNEHATYSVSNDEITITSDTSVAAVKGRFRALTTNHVYLGSCYVKSDGTAEVGSGFRGDGGISVTTPTSETLWSVPTSYVYQERIGKATSGSIRFGIMVRNNTESGGYGMYKNVTCIDLTQMFGSAIADYIYALETANAGAGVSYFRKLFPNMDAEYTYTDASDVEHTQKLRDYQSGVLLSVSGLQSHDMRGFNAWDEEWEAGSINVNGVNEPAASRIRTKNYIPILPNTNYYATTVKTLGLRFYDADKNFLGSSYNKTVSNENVVYGRFTTPENAHYLRFSVVNATTYGKDVCISLRWDGEREGEYESYKINSYALDDSLTLRGIPKLDASNNLYYDGDTYESDGTVTRRYGVVDLGTLTWVKYSAGENYIFGSVGLGGLNYTAAEGIVTMMSSKYVCMGNATSNYGAYTRGDMTCCSLVGGDKRIYIRDDSKIDGTVDAFKASLSGIYLIYELATPTTESAEPYTNPQIVDDFGTEEYVTDSIVPVGHVTQYQPNLRAKLEMAPNSPDGDGDYIVRQTNGTNEYVELVIPKEVPDAPTADGTYIFKVTVSNGTPTYSWVSE